MDKNKKNIGSNFDDFLREQDIYKEVNELATKKLIALQIKQEMKKQGITKTKMASMMNTSRASINRLLSPEIDSLTLKTLESATNALGRKLKVEII